MTPREVEAALGHLTASELEARWSGGERSDGPDGWTRITWRQPWFDCDVNARYTFDPSARLVRIDLHADDAAPLDTAMRTSLGAPDDEGASPDFLNSQHYATWHRGGVTYTLEDYAPGGELGIVRAGQQ